MEAARLMEFPGEKNWQYVGNEDLVHARVNARAVIETALNILQSIQVLDFLS